MKDKNVIIIMKNKSYKFMSSKAKLQIKKLPLVGL